MPTKTRVLIHKSFVSESRSTYVDEDGVIGHYRIARIPKGIAVNGVPLGGSSFLARYCYPSPDNPDLIVFTFKEGIRVHLSIPVRDGNGKVAQYAYVDVSPKDLQDALEAERQAWRVRRYARSRQEADNWQLPNRDRAGQAEACAPASVEKSAIPYSELTPIQARSAASSLPTIRIAAAQGGLGLDVLVDDEDPRVRIAVAQQGYGLDKLAADGDGQVAATVHAFLKAQGLALEQWMAENPGKCALNGRQYLADSDIREEFIAASERRATTAAAGGDAQEIRGMHSMPGTAPASPTRRI